MTRRQDEMHPNKDDYSSSGREHGINETTNGNLLASYLAPSPCIVVGGQPRPGKQEHPHPHARTQASEAMGGGLMPAATAHSCPLPEPSLSPYLTRSAVAVPSSTAPAAAGPSAPIPSAPRFIISTSARVACVVAWPGVASGLAHRLACARCAVQPCPGAPRACRLARRVVRDTGRAAGRSISRLTHRLAGERHGRWSLGFCRRYILSRTLTSYPFLSSRPTCTRASSDASFFPEEAATELARASYLYAHI